MGSRADENICPFATLLQQEDTSPADRCSPLIPRLGVKLSTTILAGLTVLSAVPSASVRWRWRVMAESEGAAATGAVLGAR